MQVPDERQTQTYLLSMGPLGCANGLEKKSHSSACFPPESIGRTANVVDVTEGQERMLGES
jgi:hypothetical protein